MRKMVERWVERLCEAGIGIGIGVAVAVSIGGGGE